MRSMAAIHRESRNYDTNDTNASNASVCVCVQVEMDGLTGEHVFDSGRRDTLQLDVLQLRSNGLLKVAISVSYTLRKYCSQVLLQLRMLPYSGSFSVNYDQ